MSCSKDSACVYVRCGVVCPFGCVNRHEAFETAHRARLDADGTAKPLTEIVAVMAESAIGEDHKTVHIGQATHYVARPTRTAIPRACIDAGECQRRDIIEACAKAVEACPNGLSERIEDAAARVRALGGTAKVEVGHEPDQVSDHAEGAGAERSAPAPGHAGNATPLWQDYEIDTDDVCTLDGFDGVCLMTGEVHVETGLLMSRETARSLAFRLDGLLRHIENASPMPSAAPACANCYDPATGRCIGCRQCQPGELDQAGPSSGPVASVARGPMLHKLKTHTPYFHAIVDGAKTFEVRRNDRDYRIGDVLRLEEWNPGTGYTDAYTHFKVSYLAQGVFGLPADVCVMAIVPAFHRDIEEAARAKGPAR